MIKNVVRFGGFISVMFLCGVLAVVVGTAVSGGKISDPDAFLFPLGCFVGWFLWDGAMDFVVD